MTSIGASITSTRGSDPGLIEIQNKILPAFLAEAENTERPIQEGWTVDSPGTIAAEQAISVDVRGNPLLHVIDFTSVGFSTIVGAEALKRPRTIDEATIFIRGVIKHRMYLGSLDTKHKTAMTPTLTLGLGAEGEPFAQRTRFQSLGYLDRNETHADDPAGLRDALSAFTDAGGHPQLSLGDLETRFTRHISKEFEKTLEPPYNLMGRGLFHQPLSHVDDFRNQHLISAHLDGRLKDGLLLSGEYSHTEADATAKTIDRVSDSVNSHPKEITSDEFSYLADFWDNPPDNSVRIIRSLFPPGDSDTITPDYAEKIAIGALQAALRTNATDENNISNLRKTMSRGGCNNMKELSKGQLDMLRGSYYNMDAFSLMVIPWLYGVDRGR